MDRNPPKMSFEKNTSSQEAAPKDSGKLGSSIDIAPMEENYQRRALTAMKKREEEDNKKKNSPRDAKPENKPEEKLASSETERMTSENYQKIYLQRKAAEEAKQQRLRQEQSPNSSQQQKAAANKAFAEKEAANNAATQQRKDDEMRFRARELQDKIAYWEKQRGSSMYDDNTINCTIDDIQRELGTIPLWLQN